MERQRSLQSKLQCGAWLLVACPAPICRIPNSANDEVGAVALFCLLKEPVCARWGLVPSFTKKGSLLNHYRMFNARSERLRESPVFKRLIHSKRCVVVMNGFYEWHKESSKKKQPYYIHFGEKNITKFAALYDTFESKTAKGRG